MAVASAKLRTLPVAVATATVVAIATSLLLWQLGRQEAPDDPQQRSASASGRVTRVLEPQAPPLEMPPTSAGVASGVVTPMPAPSRPTPAAKAAEKPARHPVSPQASRKPPVLPNELNTVVDASFGHKTLARHLYLEPLARRFVASVDGLGQPTAPTTLWLLRPPRGEFQLDAKGRMAASNTQRYEPFVRWLTRLDPAALLDLYARSYPLLQDSYVELGHAGGHFNDRVIEVIDLMLATPARKGPLLVKPAPPRPAGLTPPKPRYEIADPALEGLNTGQKILLRLSPEQAAAVKQQLKALRAGLVRLERERR